MNVKKSALVVFFCCIASIFSFSQKNELSFSIGVIHSSDQKETLSGISCPLGITCSSVSTSTDNGVAFEGNYARQLFRFGPASLDFEVPLVGAPGRDLSANVLGTSIPGVLSTSTFFLTPSARVKFHGGPISPFLSLGGGWAHFGATANISSIAFAGITIPGTATSFSNTTNSGALQFGGGLDFKTPLPHLAFRAEVRDFWAVGIARPSSLFQVSPERQHNIFAGGGVVFRF
jgi:hypothetical protein